MKTLRSIVSFLLALSFFFGNIALPVSVFAQDDSEAVETTSTNTDGSVTIDQARADYEAARMALREKRKNMRKESREEKKACKVQETEEEKMACRQSVRVHMRMARKELKEESKALREMRRNLRKNMKRNAQ